MPQDELWNLKYQENIDWMKDNKRNPSKYYIEEHDHLNWIKYNRKMLESGKMKVERIPSFSQTLTLIEGFKRVDQWV